MASLPPSPSPLISCLDSWQRLPSILIFSLNHINDDRILRRALVSHELTEF
jgi:hypothetical protein